MSKRLLVLMCSIFLIVPLLFMGCGSGSDGSTGAAGANGTNGTNGTNGRDLTAAPQPESCAVCHNGQAERDGQAHQDFYDSLYQDNVVRVTNLAYAFNGSNQDVVTFTMTKAGENFDCTKVTNLNIYFTQWDNVASLFQFSPSRGSLSIKASTLVYDGAGGCTSTKASFDNVSLSTKNGYIVVYGYDQLIGTLPPSRVKEVSYPYAQLLKMGTVNFVSAANVSGCEKCHIIPFLKHGNIYGQVNHDPATDFITCKACHLDDRPGGHQFWQELVDDPVMATRSFNGTLTAADITKEQTTYAYKTKLMNDVHMSHAMEFGYPQSMANCATCHEGKLNMILTDDNFTIETCKSCHPVTGSAQAEKTQPALAAVIPHTWTDATNCKLCHGVGGIAPVFSAIHTGYDKIIYGDATGTKYSAAITVTIDNASYDNTNTLRFGFSAAGSLGGLSAANIKPTILVGLYGWNTKDFLFGPHESTGGIRNLEYTPGATGNSTRMTLTSDSAGHWTATANLSTWADNIVAGNVKRVEIAVLPNLKNSDNVAVALNAPSKTFDLKTKAFVNFYPAIVKVATGCNNCHDALATTFHTADRGGNIVVCRLCHITKSGGSHLEMQSRSIDSYTHAIHTFQPFDIQNVHFDNAVQSMFYDLKIESQFPTFDRQNCVSCHNTGMFNVPDQAKSLPGVFSASRFPLIGWVRNIGTVPSYTAGPASRACGACHRAVMIKEDNEVELASFNSHTRTNGYLLENADITTVIFQVMSNFEETIVLPAP